MEKNIHKACLNGDQDLINTLLFDDPSCINSRDQDQRTPLHWACVGSHTDIVFWLLERPDIDINAKDESGLNISGYKNISLIFFCRLDSSPYFR